MYYTPRHSRGFLVHLLLVLLLSVLALAVQYVLYDMPVLGVDDANIFFTYARNLASGKGFVYTGNGEPVEGFSSLLYTLLCAAAFAVGSMPEIWIQWFNCGLAALALVLLLSVLETIQKARWVRAVFLAWTFASPSFLTWTQVSSMDTSLWLLVLSVATFELCRRVDRREPSRTDAIVFSAAIFLSVLTRPEALVLAPVLVGAWFAIGLIQGMGRRSAARACLLPGTSFVAATVGLTLFRLLYFESWLPNTYYAKVSPDVTYRLANGISYLRGFVRANPFVLLSLLLSILGSGQLVVVCLRRLWRADRAPSDESSIVWIFRSCSLVALAGFLVPVLVGGDFFVMFRFYQPLWPIFGMVPIVFALWVSDGRAFQKRAGFGRVPKGVRLGAPLVVLAVLYFTSWPRWDTAREVAKTTFKWANEGRREGEVLNDIQDRVGPLEVGVTLAGGVGFQHRGTTIDLLGLNHRAMARSSGDRKGDIGHGAFDPGVFWELEPDMLLPQFIHEAETFDVTRMRSNRAIDVFLKGLAHEKRFQDVYVVCLIHRPDGPVLDDPWFFYPVFVRRMLDRRLPTHPRSALAAFCHRGVVDRLRSAGYVVTAYDW